MKVKVTAEFKDKHTGELHRSGEILDLNIQRINEILTVGSFIELVEPVEQSESEKEETEKEKTEQTETAEPSTEDQEESEAAGEHTEETPKQTGRRKRSR